MPPEEVWKRFSSEPQWTGGVIRFPYYRVDGELVCCSNYFDFIYGGKISAEEEQEYYKEASNRAMGVALWIEVGFEGLENLAVHPSSRDWTSRVGHFVDDEQRARGIMTKGKEYYDYVMRRFVDYRDTRQITQDCFTKYGLEWILDKWRGEKVAMKA